MQKCKIYILSILIFVFIITKIDAQNILENPEIMQNIKEDSTSTFFYENGDIRTKYIFKNHGVWNIEMYNEDGTSIFFGTLKDGNGTIENRVNFEGVRVRTIGYYKDGKPYGNWQIYRDSIGKVLLSEVYYENGKRKSEINYDEKGRKRVEEFYNENKEIINRKFYKKGKLKQEDIFEYPIDKKTNKRTKTLSKTIYY